MICIGYAGYEAFDVILYIGRTLTKLNYRVLIVDLKETKALSKTIKHGMGLDSMEEIVNYRDINYTRKIPSKEELELFQEGVIFLVCGRTSITDFPIVCNKMNIVINPFPYMIEEINNHLLQDMKYEGEIRLLIRDIITLDDVDRVKKSLTLQRDIKKISYLYLDLADYESAVNCQISQVVRFTGVSKAMENYVIEQIQDMFPHIRYLKIKKAVAAARKGV